MLYFLQHWISKHDKVTARGNVWVGEITEGRKHSGQKNVSLA